MRPELSSSRPELWREAAGISTRDQGFRALIERSFDAVILLAEDGVITYASPSIERVLGYTAEEFIGRNAFEFMQPDAVPQHKEGYGGFLTRPGDSSSATQCYRHKDGSWRWLEARATNLLGEPGVRAIVVNCRDVTDRKRTEAERDQLLGRLRLQIERLPLACIIVDAESRVTDWNPAAQRIFGYTRDEMLGRQPRDYLVPPHERARLQELMNRLRAGDMDAHSINANRTRDGRTIICEWHNTPLLDREGHFSGVLSLAQNITERRQAEEVQRLRDRAIQAVSQGILIADATEPHHPIIYASPGFERLTGYTAAEVLGRTCELLHGRDTDPATIQQLQQALREERSCAVEILNYRKDGTPFWNALTLSPVHDATGRVTHCVAVLADVTERRRLEAQYHHAQKMEAVGQLAGGLAHDFNNLLTVINGYADLVLAMLPPDSAAREPVGEMLKAGERATVLTRQLLTFSRKQLLAPRVLNLNTVVIEMEKLLRRMIGEDIELATRLQPAVGNVKADPSQLEQVILNLAVNARDAMPQGGKLTIETRNVDLGDGFIRRHMESRPGPHVLLAVTDTGVGMSEEIKGRIFEPFFTTKEPGRGTGLGLATVHGIVKQSQGFIEVYSELGHGTSFKVYLPRIEDPIAASKSHHALRPAARGTETVLLAEDDETVRVLSRRILQASGYHVLTVGNGEEALRLAEQHQEPIHLLISDVVMPSMGGRQLAQLLRGLHPETKVLFLSGYTDDTVIRHGLLEDQMHFLQKPFTPVGLALKVREVLDAPLDLV